MKSLLSIRNLTSRFAKTGWLLLVGAVGHISIVSAQPYAYVPVGTPAVNIVNLANGTLVASMPAGLSQQGVGVVLNANASRLYVTEQNANAVSVYDTVGKTLITTINVGGSPQGIAINPAGTRIYVANTSSNNVSVIDPATNTVVATVPAGGFANGVAVNPSGTRVYVSNQTANTVTVIDATSNTVVATVPVGANPQGVAVVPDGSRVYVGNISSNSVSVIDTATNTVTATVSPITAAGVIAINPTGTKAYVVNSSFGANAVSVINLPGNTLGPTIPVGNFPYAVTVDPTGSSVYVTNKSGGNLSVIDIATDTVTNTIAVGANPTAWGTFIGTPPLAPITASVINTADSGPGSLRQAILDANNGGNCPPSATINFNIPGAGPHIISPASSLPSIDCPMVINGYSQPGAVANSLPNASAGSNAVIKIRIDGISGIINTGLALTFGAAGSSVRGLSITGFSGPAVQIQLSASSVSVAGNFLGVAPDGTPAGNGNGVEVFGDVVQIGASAPAARNVIACNSGEGITIVGSADIYNNEIGTRPDGTTACGNSAGINFKGANGGSVGTAGAGNFIRNNLGDGIFLDSTDFVPIQNNVIVNNSGSGITFGTRSDCAGAGNTFKGNSIGTQGGLGILLQAFGSRAVNDPLDVDGGCGQDGNRGQNYPVIDLVTYRPDKTLLDFTLPSEASKTYDIEVFSNAVADINNHGRGETSRATTTVSTDATGSVSVTNFVVSNTAPDALNISMLATEQSQGDTSEFSYAYITPASFSPLAGFSAFAITAGGNQSQTITFTNILGQALSFSMPSILPAGNFIVTANTCGLSVAFPGTCQITVQYARAMAGLDSAVLEVTLPLGSNPPAVGASTKFQFPLSGTATAAAPAITVTGTTTFPATSLNAQSAIQTITITNTGGVNLSISAIANSNSSAFFDTTNGAPPQAAHYCGFGSNAAGVPLAGGPIIIAPMATCQLNIAFKAIAVGANTANIVISSNDPMFATRTVTLTGTGVAAPPAATLAVAPGTVLVNATSILTLTLTTPSAPNDTISSAAITLPTGVSVAAMPAPTTTCGATVTASGQTIGFSAGSIPTMPGCTVTVPITATAAGSYTITLAAGALATAKGTNASAATAALIAGSAPTMAVAFAPTSVATGVNSNLTVTLGNPDPASAFISGGSITLPPNLVGTAPMTNTCGTFGSFSSQTYSFGMGSIPAMGSCTIVIGTQSATPGSYAVSVNAGQLTAGAGSNANTSIATLMVAAPAPTVVLSNGSLGFGSRTVNTTSPAQTVTLTNGGTANLVITSITSAGDFGYTTTCPIGTPPIAPAAAPCNIDITFTPLTVGALAGSVTIVSNATGSPHVISVTGTGAAVAVPGILVSASTLNLGSTVINTTGASQSIVVTNSGFATLNLTGIAVTGTGFARVAPSTGSPANCGTSVAPSGTCQIAIACTPTAVGTIAGQLAITHNATGGPTNIALSCTGNPLPVAVIALTPGVDFGDQIVNTPSTVRNVSIGNTGTVPLTISAIAIAGANANQFAQTGVCTSVAPGASCPLNVTFTPTSTGAKVASISVTSNAQNAAALNTVALTGNGVLAPRPLVNLSLTAIGYGNSIFGGASSSQTITLKNDGGLPLAITSMTALGDFVVSNNCGTSVASLGTCNITVAFTPLGVGARSGEFVIVSNAQGSPHRVVLSGTGCRWFSQAGSRLFLTSCGN